MTDISGVLVALALVVNAAPEKAKLLLWIVALVLCGLRLWQVWM